MEAKNEDFYTFGMEIIAPADGKVTFASNDVPDNKKPGKIDSDVFMKMSDPISAFPGNNVIIDHGNGEFSFLAHMKMGSVSVKTGDTVKAGQVIGLLGNSGNSDGPHFIITSWQVPLFSKMTDSIKIQKRRNGIAHRKKR